MDESLLSRRHERVRAQVAGLCAGGLPVLELFRRLAVCVREMVPYAAGGWLTMDPATLLFTGGLVEQVERSDCLRIKDNELSCPDFAKFNRIARSGRHATTLRSVTGGEIQLSARYREIYRRLGVQDEIRAVFRSGDAVLGAGCFIRVGDDRHFSPADVAFFDSIGTLVGEGLRRSLLLEESGLPGSGAPGVIVLEPDESVYSMTDAARDLIERMTVNEATPFELPSVIYQVSRLVRSGRRDGQSTCMPVRVRLPSGPWLLIHASPLTSGSDDVGRIAIVLEPAKRAQLASLIVDLYGLTEREREVTELLARGLAMKEIATVLSISRHTARDHVKAIFSKFAVSSRPELTAKLFHQHYSSRTPAQRAEA
jgi:DNA-binding CsgD family transcriptional regulator